MREVPTPTVYTYPRDQVNSTATADVAWRFATVTSHAPAQDTAPRSDRARSRLVAGEHGDGEVGAEDQVLGGGFGRFQGRFDPP